MTKKLLDISDKLDPGTIAIYRDVADVAGDLNIDYLVVGASGRDLIFQHAYGVEVQRATNDYDFAFEVADIAAYEALRSTLISKGFQPDRQSQRLVSPRGVDVDLVPFGDLADEAGNITLPPEHDHKMSVLGFPEALASAQIVRMSQEPVLDVPVVSLPGLVLLKLIAWSDRPREKRAKDAQDFRYVIESFLKIPEDVSRIWEEANYIERFEGDIEQVSAAILGRQTREIADDRSAGVVFGLLTGDQLDAFTVDMDARLARSPSNSPLLVDAFLVGFRGD
jgi:predicted nucleotidyltransferase